MTMSRTDSTLLRGPAIVQYDSQTLYTAGGITVVTRPDLFPIPVDGFADADERIKQVVTEVTFTPSGAISAGILTVLYPHTQCNKGASGLPATDKTLVIWPMNGKEKLTYTSAFVSKMPDMILGATKAPFGSMTFTCIGANNGAWSGATNLVANATAAFTDVSLSISAHKTGAYSAALGALGAPWNGIITKDGWTISFDVGLQPDEVDDVGNFDWLYTGAATIHAKCNPRGISVANLHALMHLQDTGMVRGRSILDLKYDLVLTGPSGGISATLKNLTLQSAPHQYKDLAHRIETLELVSVRNITTGAQDALFSVGAVA